MPSTETRCGFIALVGRPNAGKSTLLNALVGERLSIVSPKAQTTQRRFTGLRTDAHTQYVFLDTPGLLEPRSLFDRSLVLSAEHAIQDADVVVVLLDGTGEDAATLARLKATLGSTSTSVLPVVTKVDIAKADRVAELRAWAERELGATPLAVAVPAGTGLGELLAALRERLPESPFHYPEDDLTTESLREIVAEMVRQVILERYRQEIPYSVVCRVEEYREAEVPIYIQVTIHVERESQKGILIGKGGAGLRRVGTEARRRIEHLVGAQVYLDLWVKVLKDWRRRPAMLASLGFVVPGPEEPA